MSKLKEEQLGYVCARRPELYYGFKQIEGEIDPTTGTMTCLTKSFSHFTLLTEAKTYKNVFETFVLYLLLILDIFLAIFLIYGEKRDRDEGVPDMYDKYSQVPVASTVVYHRRSYYHHKDLHDYDIEHSMEARDLVP